MMNNTFFYKTKVDTGCQEKLVYDESKVSIFRNQLRTCECVLDQLTRVGNFIIGASGSDKQMCASSGARAALNIAAEKSKQKR